jgi:hypothetical protein
MSDKLNVLTSKNIPDLWLKLHPNLVPMTDVVRDLVENHVRFHWLPNSVRTPTTKKDFQEIQSRLSSILNYIFKDLSELKVIFTIFKADSNGFKNYEIEQYIKQVVGFTKLEILDEINLGKQSILKDYYDDDPNDPVLIKFVTSTEDLKNVHLTGIIRNIASQTLTNVLFIKANHTTTVTIYDGGFDIILATDEQKKLLSIRFGDWLPNEGMPYSVA